MKYCTAGSYHRVQCIGLIQAVYFSVFGRFTYKWNHTLFRSSSRILAGTYASPFIPPPLSHTLHLSFKLILSFSDSRFPNCFLWHTYKPCHAHTHADLTFALPSLVPTSLVKRRILGHQIEVLLNVVDGAHQIGYVYQNHLYMCAGISSVYLPFVWNPYTKVGLLLCMFSVFSFFRFCSVYTCVRVHNTRLNTFNMHCRHAYTNMGWRRLVGSLKL